MNIPLVKVVNGDKNDNTCLEFDEAPSPDNVILCRILKLSNQTEDALNEKLSSDSAIYFALFWMNGPENKKETVNL